MSVQGFTVWVTGPDPTAVGDVVDSLMGSLTARQLAVDHCARYGQVVKFLGVQPNYGGYVSFACRWVPYGAAERPLRTLY